MVMQCFKFRRNIQQIFWHSMIQNWKCRCQNQLMPLPINELCGCQCQAAWNFPGIQVLFKCCCLTVALALGHGNNADEGQPVQRREYHQETRQFDIQDEIFAYITKLSSSKRHIKIFEVIFSVLEKKYTHSICSRGE